MLAADHGLNNPRYFEVAESSEDGKDLVLRQLKKVELPDDLIPVDGWLDETLAFSGLMLGRTEDDATWGFAFREGVKNADIVSILEDDGYKVTIETP